MWTAVKIIAVVSATLLALLFLATLVMVTRPALLLGVSSDALANSIAQDFSFDQGTCSKLANENWRCSIEGSGASGTYEVDVDWMGCWKSVPATSTASGVDASGCIELGDVVTFG